MEIGDDDDESSSTGWSVATKIAGERRSSDFQITAGSGGIGGTVGSSPVVDGRRR
jgi:hypothetical protein